MPAMFTASFASRLDQCCAVSVSQAKNGERVLPGHVYIAPGGFHLELARNGANYVCRVHEEPPVSGDRPSVDVLFRPVARAAASNAVGIILTGMGKDGAVGLLDMRTAGASTIGQDETSCVFYGMPKAAGRSSRQRPHKARHRCRATVRGNDP
jgi:two-component system chemotaxis response regulator CheB